MTALGENLAGVCRQQLVVTERRGDCARPLVVFEPGLNAKPMPFGAETYSKRNCPG